MSIAEQALRCRLRAGINKHSGNSGKQLGSGERLLDHDAVRHALDRPICGAVARDINYCNVRKLLPSMAGDKPAGWTLAHPYIRDQSVKFGAVVYRQHG